MVRFLLVCLGGAVGTGARYLISSGAQRLFGAGTPWGTLLVNMIGSFLIMIVAHFSIGKGVISPDLRVILAGGVLGGFTTYSSFNYESLQLFNHGAALLAVMYIGATVFGCLMAGGAGVLVGRWMM